MKKIILIPLAFLLTAALILFCVSLIGNRILAPAMGENGARVSGSVIREELSLVRERITELSKLYGFTAQPVIDYVDEETLRTLNEQASRWWSTVLRDGKAGAELSWNTGELFTILSDDPALEAAKEKAETAVVVTELVEKIRESVFRVVLPVRQAVIRLGLKKAGDRVDLPNLITFFLGVPWAALGLCVLLAGLIALTAGRDLKKALSYAGSALGASALVLAAAVVLYLSAGILPMIREASQSLTIQYRTVVSGAIIRAAVMTAVLAAGCVLCLGQGLKGGRKA